MEERAVFVTTIDNPYDYFNQFDQWYAYDTQKGYNTCSLVDRIADVSTEMSDHDYRQAIEQAVDKICKWNLIGLYKKVKEE